GLAAAQREHGLAHAADRVPRRHGVEPAEVRHGALQLGIVDAGLLIASQPQRDLEDDIPPSVLSLEPAVAVAESAFTRREGTTLERGAIEACDADQRLGNLLTVRAHVLDRGAADRPRNTRQALNSGPTTLHHALQQRVPIDARPGAQLGARSVTQLDPADGDAQDEPGETCVEEHDIAATAQDVRGQLPLGGIGERGADLVLATTLDEVAGLSSEPECGVASEGDVFTQLHDLILPAVAPVLRWRDGCIKCTPSHTCHNAGEALSTVRYYPPRHTGGLPTAGR